MYDYGLRGMQERVSTTALYGGVTRGEKIVNVETKNALRKIIREIQSGAFAEEFSNAGATRDELYKITDSDDVEKARRSFEKSFAGSTDADD